MRIADILYLLGLLAVSCLFLFVTPEAYDQFCKEYDLRSKAGLDGRMDSAAIKRQRAETNSSL